MTLVINDGIHIKRKGRIGGEFAKQRENRTWIILSTDGGDELRAPNISQNGRITQQGWLRGKAKGEGIRVYTVDRISIHGRRVGRTDSV